ncbi:MAG: hypothetical protein J6K32_13255 [Clostridia bacterium]|nr:hypothetical protein [Clostridia bacterium]
MKLRIASLILLLWLLPALALAVTEGVVEDAPQVDLSLAQEVSYLPDGSYYAGDGDWTPAWGASESHVPQEPDEYGFFPEVWQVPSLTEGEIIRAKRLMEAYAAGGATGDGASVLGRTEDVAVGVYPLDPAQYDGETVFVILPGVSLTDEQLLAIIDAYAQLGLTFDPAALTYRCCMRGGGIEASRFYTQEERERYTQIAGLIRRGILPAPEAGTPDGCAYIRLQPSYFNGLDSFVLRPYRRMTDDELAALLAAGGVHDETAETDFDDVERKARAALCGRLGLPLSMPLDSVSGWTYIPMPYDLRGGTPEVWEGMNDAPRQGVGASFDFTTEDGLHAYAHAVFDKETGELVIAHMTHDRSLPIEEEWKLVNLEGDPLAAADAAERAGAALGFSGLTWHPQEESTWTNWGPCDVVRAMLPGGEWLTMYVGRDDHQVHGMELTAGPAVLR